MRTLFYRALVAILALATAAGKQTGVLIAPTVADQAGKFAHDLPALIASLVQRFDQMAPQWAKEAVSQSDTNLQNSLTEFASKAAGWIETSAKVTMWHRSVRLALIWFAFRPVLTGRSRNLWACASCSF